MLALLTPRQMFLVDDSLSMKYHQGDVAMAVWVLAKIAKKIVPSNEKMMLCFASSSFQKQQREFRSSPFVRTVQNHKFGRSDPLGVGLSFYTALEAVTKSIKDEIRERTYKSRSIYAFTDGRWKWKKGERDVQKLITDLMDSLFSSEAGKTMVSITIVRFLRPDDSPYPEEEFDDFNELVRKLRSHKGRVK